VDLPQTINVLIMAVIGGLLRIEARGSNLRLLPDAELHHNDHARPLLGFGGTLFGRASTRSSDYLFGVVVVSPDGLMGLWAGSSTHGARGEERKALLTRSSPQLTTNRRTCLKVGSLRARIARTFEAREEGTTR
jgi:hypothetical protein